MPAGTRTFVCLPVLRGGCALTKIIIEIKNILFVRRLLKANLELYIPAPPRSASSVVRLLPDTPREEEDKNNEEKMPREDGERNKVKFVNEILSFVLLSENPPTHSLKHHLNSGSCFNKN